MKTSSQYAIERAAYILHLKDSKAISKEQAKQMAAKADERATQMHLVEVLESKYNSQSPFK